MVTEFLLRAFPDLGFRAIVIRRQDDAPRVAVTGMATERQRSRQSDPNPATGRPSRARHAEARPRDPDGAAGRRRRT
jgi:hypothetical protein